MITSSQTNQCDLVILCLTANSKMVISILPFARNKPINTIYSSKTTPTLSATISGFTSHSPMQINTLPIVLDYVTMYS
jgi:hypothetical protein